jgi:hypothetical protein
MMLLKTNFHLDLVVVLLIRLGVCPRLSLLKLLNIMTEYLNQLAIPANSRTYSRKLTCKKMLDFRKAIHVTQTLYMSLMVFKASLYPENREMMLCKRAKVLISPL